MSTKLRSPKKILLCLNNSDRATPWSRLQFCRSLDIQGAAESSTIKIEVRSDDVPSHFPYLKRGPGLKHVSIPRGEVRLIRVSGTEPITVYALCGD